MSSAPWARIDRNGTDLIPAASSSAWTLGPERFSSSRSVGSGGSLRPADFTAHRFGNLQGGDAKVSGDLLWGFAYGAPARLFPPDRRPCEPRAVSAGHGCAIPSGTSASRATATASRSSCHTPPARRRAAPETYPRQNSRSAGVRAVRRRRVAASWSSRAVSSIPLLAPFVNGHFVAGDPAAREPAQLPVRMFPCGYYSLPSNGFVADKYSRVAHQRTIKRKYPVFAGFQHKWPGMDCRWLAQKSSPHPRWQGRYVLWYPDRNWQAAVMSGAGHEPCFVLPFPRCVRRSSSIPAVRGR